MLFRSQAHDAYQHALSEVNSGLPPSKISTPVPRTGMRCLSQRANGSYSVLVVIDGIRYGLGTHVEIPDAQVARDNFLTNYKKDIS